ncbi:MAG: RNase adapter RapZ [Alphaproteobacteria bacterium]|nr:RNase adapter RapZ [Alphaproteobacteria bacterium]
MGAGGEPRIVVVTGLSGAGKTAALKALEDLGYEAVDNLPLSLLGALVNHPMVPGSGLAIDIDIRSRGFDGAGFAVHLATLQQRPGTDVRLLFMDCEDEVLRRRFTETRRQHPLSADRPVLDSIRHERRLMEPLKSLADLVIDSTDMATAELRRILGGHFGREARPGMIAHVVSFAYRNGLPREADLVFDVRFLRNPFYQRDLRPLTGCDAAVGAHIEGDPGFAAFMAHLTALLGGLLPCFEAEGKRYLTIAFGCTGGQHRSVFIAEWIAAWLRVRWPRVGVQHRDISALPGADAGAEGSP